jgi:hypothetical protein
MTQLELSLDFVCQECNGNIGISIQCSGRGLEEDCETMSAVRVPCPNCQCILEVYFRPLTGEYVDQVPLLVQGLRPMPSLN